jgi:short-subunit dehydrogenase
MRINKKVLVGSAAAVTAAGTVAGVGALLAARALRRRLKPDYHFRDAVVAITGGSRGLGFALALEFAQRGARVAICARDEETLREAEHRLHAYRIQVFAFRCDIGVREQAEAFVRSVEEKFGRIDVLVNNAGQIEVGPLESQGVEDFEQAMSTMYWGMVYSSLAAYPGMARRRAGRIVNITSIGGKVAVPHLLPYCGAKFAAVGFSEGLHAELAKDNLKVTTVVPGLLRTGSHMNATFKGDHHKEYSWFALGASLPLLSMSARRAARKIVNATARGAAEIILTPQAKLAVALHGVAPGLVSDIAGVANRMMPGTGSRRPERYSGKESSTPLTRSFVTHSGREAGREFNQHPERGPVGGDKDVSSRPLRPRAIGQNPEPQKAD